jgi:hypothetical protein
MLKTFPSGLVIDPETVIALTRGTTVFLLTFPSGNKMAQEKTRATAEHLSVTLGSDCILYPTIASGNEQQAYCLLNTPCTATVRLPDGTVHQIPTSYENFVELGAYMHSTGITKE